MIKLWKWRYLVSVTCWWNALAREEANLTKKYKKGKCHHSFSSVQRHLVSQWVTPNPITLFNSSIPLPDLKTTIFQDVFEPLDNDTTSFKNSFCQLEVTDTTPDITLVCFFVAHHLNLPGVQVGGRRCWHCKLDLSPLLGLPLDLCRHRGLHGCRSRRSTTPSKEEMLTENCPEVTSLPLCPSK